VSNEAAMTPATAVPASPKTIWVICETEFAVRSRSTPTILGRNALLAGVKKVPREAWTKATE